MSNKNFTDTLVCNAMLDVKNGATSAGAIDFYEASGNGGHACRLSPADAIASDYTVRLPTAAGDIALTSDLSSFITASSSDTLINKTITLFTGNSSSVITTPSASGTLLTTNNVIGVAKGGTNLTTYTKGDIIYCSDAIGTLSKLAISVTEGKVLKTAGTGIPSWEADTDTLYTAGTNLNLSSTEFNLDAAISGLTTIGMTGKLTGTGTALNGFDLLNGNFYSSDAIYYLSANTENGFFHSNTGDTSNIHTYVDSGSSSIGNSKAMGFGLFTNNEYCLFVGNSNYWTHIGQNITTEASTNLEVTQTDSSDGRACTIKLSQTHASGDAGIEFKSPSYENSIMLKGTNGELEFGNSTTPKDNVFFGDIQTSGSSLFVGIDNTTINLEGKFNHATGSGTDSSYVQFRFNNTWIGADVRQVDSSSVSYNDGSDYRLKENINTLTNCLGIINKLQIRTWNWKSQLQQGITKKRYGLVAHEVQEIGEEIFESAVSGSKDLMKWECKCCSSFWCKCSRDCDKKCNNENCAGECKGKIVPKYQGVDYSKFSPICIASIQELHKIILEQQEMINEMKITLDKLNNSSSFKDFKK